MDTRHTARNLQPRESDIAGREVAKSCEARPDVTRRGGLAAAHPARLERDPAGVSTDLACARHGSECTVVTEAHNDPGNFLGGGQTCSTKLRRPVLGEFPYSD
jgi:hypothetical protein